jgi:hypothetical protein
MTNVIARIAGLKPNPAPTSPMLTPSAADRNARVIKIMDQAKQLRIDYRLQLEALRREAEQIVEEHNREAESMAMLNARFDEMTEALSETEP